MSISKIKQSPHDLMRARELTKSKKTPSTYSTKSFTSKVGKATKHLANARRLAELNGAEVSKPKKSPVAKQSPRGPVKTSWAPKAKTPTVTVKKTAYKNPLVKNLASKPAETQPTRVKPKNDPRLAAQKRVHNTQVLNTAKKRTQGGVDNLKSNYDNGNLQQIAGAKQSLGQAISNETRTVAAVTDFTVKRDIYADAHTAISARVNTDLGRKDDKAIDLDLITLAAVNRASTQEATPDAELNERQWQTNSDIYRAIRTDEARFALERVPESQRDAGWQAEWQSVLQRNESAWNEVKRGRAWEYDALLSKQSFINHPADRNTDQAEALLDAYRDQVMQLPYDARFQDKIAYYSDTQATPYWAKQSEQGFVRDKVDRVKQVWQQEQQGEVAPGTTLDLLRVLDEDLQDSPFLQGTKDYPLDAGMQDSRAQLVFFKLGQQLKSTHSDMAEAAPKTFQQKFGDTPSEWQVEDHLAIAQLTRDYLQLLHDEGALKVIDSTQDYWQPALEASGRSNDDLMAFKPETAIAFGDIADSLIGISGGEARINKMTAIMLDRSLQHRDLFTDKNLWSGTYNEFIDIASSAGVGDDLTLGLIERMYDSADLRSQAQIHAKSWQRGDQAFRASALENMQRYNSNREELDHIMHQFVQAGMGEEFYPGKLNARLIEMDLALQDYHQRNPDVADQDAKLMRQIHVDGDKLFRRYSALGSLLNRQDANTAEPKLAFLPDALADLDAFIKTDAGQVLGNSPLTSARMGAAASQAVEKYLASLTPEQRREIAAQPESLLKGMLEADPGSFDVPRNVRFWLTEMNSGGDPKGKYPGIMNYWNNAFAIRNAGGIREGLIDAPQAKPTPASRVPFASTLLSISGPIAFGAEAIGRGRDAIFPAPGTPTDVRIANGMMAGTFGYVTAMIVPALGANFSLAKHGKDAPVYQLWSELAEGIGARQLGTTGAYDIGPGSWPGRGIGAVFTGLDTYFVGKDILNGNFTRNTDGNNPLYAYGNALSLTGSSMAAFPGYYSSARLAAGVYGGPVFWAGTAFWVAAQAAYKAGQYKDATDRFENADVRRALSFLGAVNENTGQLKPIQWFSEPVDRGLESDQFGLYKSGDQYNPDHIYYRGLHPEWIDELLNNNADTVNPISAMGAIAAFAESEDLPTMDVLEWADRELNNQQQKTLTASLFDVDLANHNVTPAFYSSWPSTQPLVDALDTTDLSDAEKRQVSDYIFTQLPAQSFDITPSGYLLDPQRVYAAVENDTALQSQLGMQVPNAAVRDSLRQLYQASGDYVHRQMQPPTTVAEIPLWLQANGYDTDTLASPARPEPYQALEGIAGLDIQAAYHVQPGDTLWQLADSGTDAKALQAWLDYHNRNNQNAYINASLAADFDTQAIGNNPLASTELRDPDAITPQDLLLVEQGGNNNLLPKSNQDIDGNWERIMAHVVNSQDKPPG